MVNLLASKLQIKSGQRLLILNSPNEYPLLLDPLPDDTLISTELNGNHDHFQLFVKTGSELTQTLKNIYKLLLPSSTVWIMYPKKSSGIKSDLEMMSSWHEAEKYGLRPVAAASINKIWTAIRLKPVNEVKKSGLGKSEIAASSLSTYIDVENRVIKLPDDLKAELIAKPAALAFFETLSWTNKKEYITWILTAKQEKTRYSRVMKAAEMLTVNKKNPTAK